MDSEYDGGVREMMVVLVERFFDVELFEFREGLVEENSTFQHFVDQRFQSGTHQGFPG
jgi:adenosylcobinamide amidohydrolase